MLTVSGAYSPRARAVDKRESDALRCGGDDASSSQLSRNGEPARLEERKSSLWDRTGVGEGVARRENRLPVVLGPRGESDADVVKGPSSSSSSANRTVRLSETGVMTLLGALSLSVRLRTPSSSESRGGARRVAELGDGDGVYRGDGDGVYRRGGALVSGDGLRKRREGDDCTDMRSEGVRGRNTSLEVLRALPGTGEAKRLEGEPSGPRSDGLKTRRGRVVLDGGPMDVYRDVVSGCERRLLLKLDIAVIGTRNKVWGEQGQMMFRPVMTVQGERQRGCDQPLCIYMSDGQKAGRPDTNTWNDAL